MKTGETAMRAIPMKLICAAAGVALVLLGTPAIAQITHSTEDQANILRGKPYSPYAQRAFPTQVLWGEAHLHTGYSMDAGVIGNRLLHEEAYRFARGEEITASSGQQVKLSRPLDWISITDHSDQMGFVQDLIKGDPAVMKTEQGRRWNAGINAGGQEAAEAGMDLVTNFAQGTFDPELIKAYAPGSPRYASIWEHIVNTADEYNEPGRFTTLIGYEWTSLVGGRNMHRNVIYRGGASEAGQVVPMTMTAPFGSPDPLDLYKWLQDYEDKTGGQVLAIAHNGNLSNGIMFPVDRQYTGRKIDKKYVEARAKWEPLYEVTQIKGDGEAHPFLSPDDEFADYETWDEGSLDLQVAKTDDMLQFEYARAGLKNGLQLEKKFGTNPYKFGMVGGTDSHTSMASTEEDNFMGKTSAYEASPTRLVHPFQDTDVGVRHAWMMASAGLQAVWAEENTREAVFDAMQRKETYATTGSQIGVRFFGGWDFTDADVNGRQPGTIGYEKGVPMGGDLTPVEGKTAPTFMVIALKDPLWANLDRIQIIKGWMDTKGKTHEKVYDVAWSDNRKPDANGKVPPVGNTVDIETASWSNTIGDSELAAVWTDPDFDASQSAFYYARVLEIPTPRWIVYDAFKYGIDIPEGATTIGQERAYTSPIWYTPES